MVWLLLSLLSSSSLFSVLFLQLFLLFPRSHYTCLEPSLPPPIHLRRARMAMRARVTLITPAIGVEEVARTVTYVAQCRFSVSRRNTQLLWGLGDDGEDVSTRPLAFSRVLSCRRGRRQALLTRPACRRHRPVRPAPQSHPPVRRRRRPTLYALRRMGGT